MKIDMVYLWVDGSDQRWIAKKNLYLPKDRQLPLEIAGDCRFVEHDELKYSLRSLEKFAGWVNHIYIVTDGQVPTWLDRLHPKITIIDHKQIIPEGYLPTFNSVVLEFYLHKIPGLSEHFLYANDDMLFGREVAPSFFFDGDGEPIVRLAKQKIKGRKGNYQQKVYRMQMEVKRRYGRYYRLAPHHNIDAYRKRDFEEVASEFSDEIEKTSQSRFRKDSDLQRSLVLYRLLAKSDRRYVKIGRYNGFKSCFAVLGAIFSGRYMTDSRCFSVETGDLAAKFKKYNPALFAVNDESGVDAEQREKVAKFFQVFLPERSSFEL